MSRKKTIISPFEKTTKRTAKSVGERSVTVKAGGVEANIPKTRTPKQFQSLRGMRDILPAEKLMWQNLRDKCERISRDYGFERLDLPLMESTGLFERAVGKVTDIVEKEMFTFLDRGGDSVTLRPEFTAGAVRAYLEHGFMNQPQPVKWYFDGPLYRYQRPQ